jgi:GNAT superfamily N-acetyltransferase
VISYQLATNLDASAAITYQNMRPYYQHYAVNWQQAKIRAKIAELENWDILYGSAVVGAMRLAFDQHGCYIRDLQVSEKFQNKGIGAAALAECERLAANAGVKQLRLRVFKISPAYHLYIRNGFAVDKQHDNFFYMSKNIH